MLVLSKLGWRDEKGVGRGPFASFFIELKSIQNHVKLLILLVGDSTRPELTLLSVLAGGTPPWQIHSHGLRGEEFRGLEVLTLLSHEHQGIILAPFTLTRHHFHS
ncbi:MAG: hypothetical protein ACK53Y_20675, partial [bacterium]